MTSDLWLPRQDRAPGLEAYAVAEQDCAETWTADRPHGPNDTLAQYSKREPRLRLQAGANDAPSGAPTLA
eukprot:12902578-Prorocentrum_lima.AAC.1